MKQINLNRRQLLVGTAWVAVGTALGPFRDFTDSLTNTELKNNTENNMNTITFMKTAAPEWLLAMWKEIDDKTFGKGFECFAEDAVCNLGVADWHGRETIRENLRAFIDTGFTAQHDIVEYWDSPSLKVFHGKVAMTFDDSKIKPVKPTMSHFFYMDKNDPSKVSRWIGAVGPTGF
jgi:hypothetical protein